MKAFLDGNIIVNPTDALQNPSITLRKQTETGEIGFSFTGDLIFSGVEYTYLYSKLVTDANALDNKVTLKFENDCCSVLPQTYEFSITHKGLKWCEGKCELNAAAIEKTTAEEKLTCLKNTLIWDNYAGFKNKKHPRITYCNELRPSWMHDILILLSIATGTSILAFIPLIASLILLFNTINTVINFLNNNLGTSINTLSFNGQTQIDLGTVNGYWNNILSFIVGCGRKHPSPLVRDYAANVCGKCGLNFKSSIFANSSSPYYNLVYMNAPINKGVSSSDTTTFWIEENKPLLNGTKFFNEIKLPFNADWRIQGNDLIFERRDYFIPKTPWLDLTTYSKVNSVCWTWSQKQRYSFGTFYYQKDGINWVGSEAVARWGDIVEWNNPYTSLQKDELAPLIPYAACRFRDDGIDRDVLSSYKGLPSIGPIIKQYDNTILMNSHNCFTPMLLIWDGQSLDNAKVSGANNFYSGFTHNGESVQINQFYNYPMWFNANYPNNLYDNFWKIEDPRTSNYQGKDFTAEIEFDCATLSAIDLDGTILTSLGQARVNEININFGSNTMTLTGTI